MPVAAALASGLPIFVGAAHGELGLGLAGSLGGLVFLHRPATRLPHRMGWLMACAFGMTGSHSLGMPGHLVPALVVPPLVIITILATMVGPCSSSPSSRCRWGRGPWAVASVLTALALVIEILVVRHCGLATVFITPLAILLVEAGQGAAVAPQQLMQARLMDTVVGCMLGLAAAACMHSPRFRLVVGAGLRRLWPDDTLGARH